MINILEENSKFKATEEVEGGHTFFHLDVHEWSKSTFMEIQAVFYTSLNRAESPLVFMYANNDKTIKFAQMLKPLDYTFPMGEGYTIGAWKTDKE